MPHPINPLPTAGSHAPVAANLWLNLQCAALLLLLSLFNQWVHQRFPTQIGWLPAGLALAWVLMYGPKILPGVWLGGVLWLLSSAVLPLAALTYASVNTLVGLLAWYLLATNPTANPRNLGVRQLARILLVGSLLFGCAAYLLGAGSAP